MLTISFLARLMGPKHVRWESEYQEHPALLIATQMNCSEMKIMLLAWTCSDLPHCKSGRDALLLQFLSGFLLKTQQRCCTCLQTAGRLYWTSHCITLFKCKLLITSFFTRLMGPKRVLWGSKDQEHPALLFDLRLSNRGLKRQRLFEGRDSWWRSLPLRLLSHLVAHLFLIWETLLHNYGAFQY